MTNQAPPRRSGTAPEEGKEINMLLRIFQVMSLIGCFVFFLKPSDLNKKVPANVPLLWRGGRRTGWAFQLSVISCDVELA